jgi:hypothetical protein
MTEDAAPAAGGSTTNPAAGACVRSISIPKRVSLSASKRRLRIRLALDADVRAEAGLRERRRGKRLRARTRVRLRAGRRTLVLRVARHVGPGRFRVSLRLGCAGEKVVRGAKVTLRP